MPMPSPTSGQSPATMRVLGQRRFGGVEVLEELELPVPQPTGADLLVRMEAVALNPVDTRCAATGTASVSSRAATR